jgi:hypothetical protein
MVKRNFWTIIKTIACSVALITVVIYFAIPYIIRPITYKGARFSGDPEGKLQPDGRNIELLKPFSFLDSSNRLWEVPKGYVSNGASIPQLFWSIIGGPWDGRYRNPAIVHDYYCDHRIETWEDTHKMLYEGCMCAGLPEADSKRIFAAVYLGGPRWEPPRKKYLVSASKKGEHTIAGEMTMFPGKLTKQKTELTNDQKKKIDDFLKTNPSIDDIMALKLD